MQISASVLPANIIVGVFDTRSVDEIVAGYRRTRVPLLVAALISLPLAAAVVAWWQSAPTDGRGVVAGGAGSVALALAVCALMSWRWSDRARYIRFLRLVRRHSTPHHDLSSTRMCPRCGLPMDRLGSGDLYTGPA